MFDIPHRLFIEQPFSKILCIFHSILHIFTIQDDDNESTSFNLYTAWKAWSCRCCNSSLDANIEIGFCLDKMMSILPPYHLSLILLRLWGYPLLLLRKFILIGFIHIVYLLGLLIKFICDRYIYPFFKRSSALLCWYWSLFRSYWVRFNSNLCLIYLRTNYPSKMLIIHCILWQYCQIKCTWSILWIRKPMRIRVFGFLHVKLICFEIHF